MTCRGPHRARSRAGRNPRGRVGHAKGRCLLAPEGLPARRLRQMEIAQSILTKPGALTEAEWAPMKRHPEFGYEFLDSIRHLRDCGEIVRSHHERFDGQVYPRGLKGEEIPLGARIFSVVDAYTAMTSGPSDRRR